MSAPRKHPPVEVGQTYGVLKVLEKAPPRHRTTHYVVKCGRCGNTRSLRESLIRLNRQKCRNCPKKQFDVRRVEYLRKKGYGWAEIAIMMGVSEPTLKKRVPQKLLQQKASWVRSHREKIQALLTQGFEWSQVALVLDYPGTVEGLKGAWRDVQAFDLRLDLENWKVSRQGRVVKARQEGHGDWQVCVRARVSAAERKNLESKALPQYVALMFELDIDRIQGYLDRGYTWQIIAGNLGITHYSAKQVAELYNARMDWDAALEKAWKEVA